jgi:hypothetical protein
MELQTVAIVAPVAAWLSGIGLVRRSRPVFGWALAIGAVMAVGVLAGLGDLRPAAGLIAIAGLSEGIDLDQRGHRPVGLLTFSTGFLALLVAVFYT